MDSGQSFWTLWNWDPTMLIGAGLVLAVYFWLAGAFRQKDQPNLVFSRRKAVWFTLGVLTIVLGVVSPLTTLIENHVLTAHMLQHMLFTLLTPPLILSGLPDRFFSPLLKRPAALSVGRMLTNPFFTFLLFNVNFLFWHLPGVYELGAQNAFFHFLMPATFILTGMFFWWPIVSPAAELPPLTPPFQLLYIFAAAIPCTVLGVMIIFSKEVIYATHGMTSMIINLDPIEDQQIAGVLMVGAENVIYLLVMTVLFFRWLRREETGEKPI